MTLRWIHNEEEYEFVAKSGCYVLTVEQWGRRNFSWSVVYKTRVIAYCGIGETVRTLIEAKERCRYDAEKHYDKLKAKKTHAM